MMRVKHAALIAATGVILSVFSGIMGLFIPFANTLFMNNCICLIGNIFLVIFFCILLVNKQESFYLKAAGILGLIGYLIITILNLLDMILACISNIAILNFLKYSAILNIITAFNHASFFTGLISTLLIMLCLMVLYRNLDRKSHLRNTAFLAMIGQLIAIANSIIGYVLNMVLFIKPYQKAIIRNLSIPKNINSIIIVSNVESIIKLIPSILLVIFLISIYRSIKADSHISLSTV